MPPARDRLDVVVCPPDHTLVIDRQRVAALFDAWQAAGLLAAGTGRFRRTAGPRAWALMSGGFGVVWLDLPDKISLYANQLGGFSVSCSSCGRPLAREYGHAVERLREGGDDALTCPKCDTTTSAGRARLSPPGALARGAVVFGDAGGLDPSVRALRDLSAVLSGPVLSGPVLSGPVLSGPVLAGSAGGLRVVLRRRS